MNRENEELRRKLAELEQECFELTYERRRERKQGSGGDEELKQRIGALCQQVQTFMAAMKKLQRAVNNKERDLQEFKHDFEGAKKTLERMARENLERAKERLGRTVEEGHGRESLVDRQADNRNKS